MFILFIYFAHQNTGSMKHIPYETMSWNSKAGQMSLNTCCWKKQFLRPGHSNDQLHDMKRNIF